MEAEGETKSKNQLKNEEKNKAKLEKFLAKQEKLKEQVFIKVILGCSQC